MNQTDGARGERDSTNTHPEISSTETRQFPSPSNRPSFFSSFILHPSSLPFILHPSSFILSAFLLRLGVRLARGEAGFWEGSYDFYFVLARKIVAEHSFCYDATTCAYWTPGYPAFLALATWGTRAFVALAVAQALVGAGTCFFAMKLAECWFGDRRAGLLAGWICAVYPYFVVHDTALQETGLFTFLAAMGTYRLIAPSPRLPVSLSPCLPGLIFGIAALVRPTILPFVALALVWMVLKRGEPLKKRLVGAALFGLAFGLTVLPWMVRNQAVVGRFVMGIRTGHSLWIGNNPDTFARYPTESIDRSTDLARTRWTPAEQVSFAQVSKSETAQDDWYFRRAMNFIRTHPADTLVGAVRKNLAGFSVGLNPAKGLAEQLAYGFSYGPVLLLAFIGAWRLRKHTAAVGPVAAHIAGFAVVTAVFWAHTSHRSYLDVYFIALAAGTITTIRPGNRSTDS